MADRFAGRVAAVGGAGLMARAIARRFAEEGAKVFVIDRGGDDLREAGSIAGVHAVAADTAVEAELDRAFAGIGREAGRLDAYVHICANDAVGPAADLPTAVWQEAAAGRLAAAFRMSQLAGRMMLAQGGGAIVHVASTDAVAPRAGHLAASAAHAAVLGLSRALGVEWSARGVRVNAVAPGMIEGSGDSRSEAAERYRMRTPLGRFGRPEEVAEAVLYLASDEAKFVTAECLRVDGGWLAYSYFHPAVTNSEHR